MVVQGWEQGHSEAKAKLDVMHQEGKSVPQDDSESVISSHKADEDSGAHGNISGAHIESEGVSQDV